MLLLLLSLPWFIAIIISLTIISSSIVIIRPLRARARRRRADGARQGSYGEFY